ncbi:dynein light chain Tctex-type 5 [Suncus etruscus]|uniref:dynein light chain Tctex-type 5 n=1 Tax=Suncus etruscus TaxID=109475 RepID=UPI00210FACAB|nr:dynein light chain Tctex-type 5 [Suncus etruscus]
MARVRESPGGSAEASLKAGTELVQKRSRILGGREESQLHPGCKSGSSNSSNYAGQKEDQIIMADMAKDRRTHLLKKRESHQLAQKGPQGRPKNSMNDASHPDESSQRSDVSHLPIKMENTYQLGPARLFPTVVVKNLLKDVLTNSLEEEHYEPEFCRQMTKTISEVIKGRIKDLNIPRYKLIVLVHIGQLKKQGILIGSRCLWDPKNDTFSSYVFRNASLFALASVYAVYFE